MLKVWDWMSGKLLSEISILDTLEPHIKVKAPRGKREREDGDNEDGNERSRNIGRRKRGRKGKARAQEIEQPIDEADQTESGLPPEDVDMAPEELASEDQSGAADAPIDLEDVGSTAHGEQTVLVVHKIQSVDLSSNGQGRHLVFSAVGSVCSSHNSNVVLKQFFQDFSALFLCLS